MSTKDTTNDAPTTTPPPSPPSPPPAPTWIIQQFWYALPPCTLCPQAERGPWIITHIPCNTTYHAHCLFKATTDAQSTSLTCPCGDYGPRKVGGIAAHKEWVSFRIDPMRWWEMKQMENSQEGKDVDDGFLVVGNELEKVQSRFEWVMKLNDRLDKKWSAIHEIVGS